MFNLIKMDMYRLIHSLSTWVILIFTVAAAVFAIAMTNLDMQASQNDNSAGGTASDAPIGFSVTEREEDGSSDVVMGIYVTGNPEWENGKMELGDVISMEMQSGLTAMLCVIFVAIFTNADQKNGYIKNIAGQFPGRGKLILSKLTAIALQVFIILAVFAAVTVTTSFIFWNSKVFMASWPALFKVLGVQYLLHLGIAIFIMFLTIVTRSTAFGSTTGILLISGITSFLYAGINQIVTKVKPDWGFDLNNYMPESNMKLIGIDTLSDALLRSAIVGIVFVILFTALTMITIKKRDVR